MVEAICMYTVRCSAVSIRVARPRQSIVNISVIPSFLRHSHNSRDQKGEMGLISVRYRSGVSAEAVFGPRMHAVSGSKCTRTMFDRNYSMHTKA